MTSLKLLKEKIVAIGSKSFFTGNVNSFWNSYAIATDQVVGEWDGTESFKLTLSLSNSTVPEIHHYSLNMQIQNTIKQRFEDLIELLHDELSVMTNEGIKANRVNRILNKIKETEITLQVSDLDEKYKNLIIENFELHRVKFESEFSYLKPLLKSNKLGKNGFKYIIKNYENFKLFYQNLKKNGLIPADIKIGKLERIFTNNTNSKIEWAGNAKETNYFFKTLKAKKIITGPIWVTVEENFILRNTKGIEITRKQMRSLDVFNENIKEDKIRKRELRSIIDLL
ncbi:hypothetical protein BC962_0860 [Gillisia mitskevichiae]|uniref:Uncharacterized protein n=1 Tax=Gillisia mitskevichiae TaxID=270921 RepID=A0A495PZD2_9FLAO|nr:hypothetical protein [Gillisia mitskevichiae]RKS55886.1 hypothetical protein BC962_0860 [Gillisia mitskevichiae]